MHKILLLGFISMLLPASLFAQLQNPTDALPDVQWEMNIKPTQTKNEYQLTAKAKVPPKYHIFGQNPGDDFLIPTHFEFDCKKIKLINVKELGELKTEEMEGVGTIHYFEKEVSFVATIHSKYKEVKGFIEYQMCNATMCFPPTQKNFKFTVK